MSLKMMPGFGKSGTSRMAPRSSSVPGADESIVEVTLADHGERSWKLVEPRRRKLADVVDPRTRRTSPGSR